MNRSAGLSLRANPSLVLTWLVPNVPVHAVIALDPDRDRILMVTVYQPSEEEWKDDWKTRQ